MRGYEVRREIAFGAPNPYNIVKGCSYTSERQVKKTHDGVGSAACPICGYFISFHWGFFALGFASGDSRFLMGGSDVVILLLSWLWNLNYDCLDVGPWWG